MDDDFFGSIMDQLSDQDFRKFKWKLKLEKVDNIEPIANAKLEKADRLETVGLIMSTYDESNAPVVMKNVLAKIPRNDLVKKVSDKLGPAACPVATPCVQSQEQGAVQKLRGIRSRFIEGVSPAGLTKLQDKLLDQRVIGDHDMEEFNATPNKSTRAANVIDTVTKKGERASSILIKALCEEDKFLAEDLKLM